MYSVIEPVSIVTFLLYTIIKSPGMLLLWLAILTIYTFISLKLGKNNKNSVFTIFRTASWDSPFASKFCCKSTFVLDSADKFLQKKNENREKKLTMTHILLKGAQEAFRAVEKANCTIKFGV